MDHSIPTSEYMTPLDRCPALVLNADYRPLSYYPLSLWPWQEAVKAIFRETVVVLSEYGRVVRSPGMEMKLPAVLVLKEYVQPTHTPSFTRYNVFLRDGWTCQYCGQRFKTEELTFDHVIPRSQGGKTNWTNIVTACKCCNSRKGDKLPKDAKMHPLTAPYEPSVFELQEMGRHLPHRTLHESWSDFLYWDTELEEG